MDSMLLAIFDQMDLEQKREVLEWLELNISQCEEDEV